MTLPIVLVPAVAVAVALFGYRRLQRINALVEQWATLNRYTLLRYGVPWLPPWPPLSLLFGTTRSQSLRRIRIYDETAHHIRNGWLRLGTRWWGLLDLDAVEVFWADD
jgi:hypothetical protein